MSDESLVSEASVQRQEVRIERIYLKDSSFESPGSPEVFGEKWQPEINVDINTRANTIGESGEHGEQRFEVTLTCSVRAKRENSKTAFIVEVQQSGLFVLAGLDRAQQQRVLGTVCPTTLFPYLRESIDNLVVKGGFPALQLAPVNFEALFQEAMARNEKGEDSPVQH